MDVPSRNRNFLIMSLAMIAVSLSILAMMTYAANIM